ncbi:MAG: chromate reductase [Candidatus Midichloriaceae bacterium]|jgi:chromate reductase
MSVLFLSGSIRMGSYNKLLVNFSYEYAKNIGIDAKLVNLSEYDMPIYNADLENESGIPESVKELKKLFIESKGFFISTPEYNGFFSPLLKNIIDWLSRPSDKDEAPLIAFKGKVAALNATSPGTLGGIRALPHLRLLLSNVGVIVLPGEIAIPNAFENFDDDGNLLNDNLKKAVYHSIDRLKEYVY